MPAWSTRWVPGEPQLWRVDPSPKSNRQKVWFHSFSALEDSCLWMCKTSAKALTMLQTHWNQSYPWLCSTWPQSTLQGPSASSSIWKGSWSPVGTLGAIRSLILVSWSVSWDSSKRSLGYSWVCPFSEKHPSKVRNPGSKTCLKPSILWSAGRSSPPHNLQCLTSVSATRADHAIQGPIMDSKDQAGLWRSQAAPDTWRTVTKLYYKGFKAAHSHNA